MDDLTYPWLYIDAYYSGCKGYLIDKQAPASELDICCASDIIIMKVITIQPIVLCLTLLLVFLAFVTPVSSQLLSGNFSPEYVQMLKETRTHHEWWKTCRRTAQEMREDVCYQYFLKPIEENLTEIDPTKFEAEESSDADNKQEFSLLDVATIIGEEIYKVALQTWSDVVDYLNNSEEEVIPVQYDDNFASLYGGAIILRKSSSKIHNAQAILEDNSEKYLFSDEKLPIEIIIALKQEVKISRISIKSNQIYSSTVKSFILEGALDLSEDEDQQGQGGIWFKLLSAQAKNSGMEQKFRTKNKAVRFLRLRILSQYGDWKYFTMTQLKVYGSGLFTEALIDYQTVHTNTTSDTLVNEAQLQLTNDLSLIYKQLNNNFGEEQQKKPDENVLTFLLEKVNILSKIHQFHIFYMNNMSQRLENITKVQQDFREHKNQYQAKNSFEEKYRQHRKVQQKIAELEQNFRRQAKKYNQFMQQFKYSDTPATEQCPNKEEQVRTMLIYAVCITVVLNVIITALVGYCYFKYFRGKQEKK